MQTLTDTQDQQQAKSVDLPVGLVKRLIKSKAKEAVLTGSDFVKHYNTCLRVFIHYITSIADDISREHRKQIIVEKDIQQALSELGFDSLVDMFNSEEFKAKFKGNNSKLKRKHQDLKSASQINQTLDSDIQNGTQNVIQDTLDIDNTGQMIDDSENKKPSQKILIDFNEDFDDEEEVNQNAGGNIQSIPPSYPNNEDDNFAENQQLTVMEPEDKSKQSVGDFDISQQHLNVDNNGKDTQQTNNFWPSIQSDQF